MTTKTAHRCKIVFDRQDILALARHLYSVAYGVPWDAADGPVPAQWLRIAQAGADYVSEQCQARPMCCIVPAPEVVSTTPTHDWT